MNMVERMARANYDRRQQTGWECGITPTSWEDAGPSTRAMEKDCARAALAAAMEPTEGQWGGLARQIIMWLDMMPKTPRALFQHLERSGYGIPQWLRDEPEMQSLDRVPSKGTRAVIVYRAMLTAALDEGEG